MAGELSCSLQNKRNRSTHWHFASSYAAPCQLSSSQFPPFPAETWRWQQEINAHISTAISTNIHTFQAGGRGEVDWPRPSLPCFSSTMGVQSHLTAEAHSSAEVSNVDVLQLLSPFSFSILPPFQHYDVTLPTVVNKTPIPPTSPVCTLACHQYRTRGWPSHLPLTPWRSGRMQSSGWRRNIMSIRNQAEVSRSSKNSCFLLLLLHILQASLLGIGVCVSLALSFSFLQYTVKTLTIWISSQALQSSKRKPQLLENLYFLFRDLTLPSTFFIPNPMDSLVFKCYRSKHSVLKYSYSSFFLNILLLFFIWNNLFIWLNRLCSV